MPIPQPFRCLGHDSGVFYYFPFAGKQVVPLTPPQHTALHMMQLGPTAYWQEAFYRESKKDKIDWQLAAETCMELCRVEGIYDDSMVRGRGCWIDAGKVVFHTGKTLVVDGKETPLDALKTSYFYEHRKSLHYEPVEPATASQGAALLALIRSMNWKRSIDGDLLAGWLFIAPICGLLKWRPHIWLTAPKGTGKTWTIDYLVSPILGHGVVKCGSSSTEPGLRQELASDALPIVQDEAETEDIAGAERIQRIIELARLSSSGDSPIVKGTQTGTARRYFVRSMFCFASINVAAVHGADVSRISVLEMLKREGKEGALHFANLCLQTDTLITSEFCAAIRERAITMARVARVNAARFSDAITHRLGDRRQGDQLGALFSGMYTMTHDYEITKEEAAQWVAAQAWTGFHIVATDTDETKALNHLLAAWVKKQDGYQTDIGSLIAAACGYDIAEEAREGARHYLRLHGVMVRGDWVYFSNSHPKLAEIFRGTQWMKKWKDQFSRVAGSEGVESIKIGTMHSRAVRIPITFFVGEPPQGRWPESAPETGNSE